MGSTFFVIEEHQFSTTQEGMLGNEGKNQWALAVVMKMFILEKDGVCKLKHDSFMETLKLLPTDQ